LAECKFELVKYKFIQVVDTIKRILELVVPLKILLELGFVFEARLAESGG
jgi:hypothetical protein